uniref:Ubiquitin associated protein 2a n=1 Tax=Oncorhynchus mykiss TaxID=8022 RepID=A0A8C7PCK9_ONCMY
MMTSLGGDKARGTRDKVLPAATHTTQPQKQLQATAEQIRLAQMIYDKNDSDFEDKVNQLMEVTGKNQDECMVALHDCNEDVNRAINFLLESTSDTTSWETVGKKKPLAKEGPAEGKENREKRGGEREVSRGRGGSNRRGRGASNRSRQGERGRGPRSLSNSIHMSTLEDWAAEDWSEDLSETKVFTASSAPAPQNHIIPGQSLDHASMLQKPVGGEEAPSSQSLVFTNSHHHPARNGSAVGTGSTSYAHAALSSVLGAGFGDLGQSKRSQSSPGAQILEQLKGPGLGPLPSSQAAPPPSTQGTSSTSLGSRLPGLGVAPPVLPPPSTSSWDIKTPEPSTTTTSLTSHFSREFRLQPEPSLVLSHLVQRHGAPSLPLACQSSPPPAQSPSPSQGPPLAAIGAKPAPSAGPDPQGSSSLQQQHRVPQLKAQKRRIPPTSKIPSSAVEMPGSADIPGLNVQFGALDFGSEATLPDFGPVETCVSVASRAPAPQSQTNLYSKPLSESMGTPLSIPLPLSSSEPIYHSPSVAMPSLAPSAMGMVSSSTPSSSISSSVPSSSSTSPFVSLGSGYDCGPVAPHSRLAFSQSKEAPGPIMVSRSNIEGHRTSSASSTPKPESPSPSISTSSAPAPSALMPSSIPPHSSALPSLPHDMPSASLSLHQAQAQSLHQAPAQSLHQVNSSMAHIMGTMSHMNSMVSSMGGTSGLHASQALGLSANGTTAQSNLSSAPRTAPLLSSSTGKAHPNLSQGGPPLLPNQYIMGPGGLLPAYPQIYGYEDLHMLQSRLPMDYYGITFPGPTALSGRDGSLANNPYSGEVTKFGRGDSTSPAPPSNLSAQQQPQQGQTQAQPQPPQPQGQPQPQGHHSSQQQQAFLPPGYSYTGLPYYPGMPGAAFQYGHTMFMPQGQGPAKQHGVGLGNPSASPFQQQPSGYGQHTFSSGYEDLTQGQAGVDYSKGYSNSSQSQAKSAATGAGKGGISVTSGNTGIPEISGSVYNKTQSFDKQGFHTGTPPPFNLPSALGGPGGAPGGYAPAPFLHILQPAHQQPHSQMLHHHLAQDGQGGPSQRGQSSSIQQKSQVNKSSYGSSPYWGN